MVPRKPLSKHHACSGCIEFSTLVGMLASFFPQYYLTFSKEMLPFNKSHLKFLLFHSN
jgi:hypothetical protein